MGRIESLSILLDPTGKELLAEKYGDVIGNVQKNTISGQIKNTNLSGDPTTGSVEAKRFANMTSQPYGTARAAGAGGKTKAKPVTVKIDQDRELLEEIEQKDVKLYGVDSLVNKKTAMQGKSMGRELERAFFQTAADAATAVTPTATTAPEQLEELIVTLETVQNDYVDGVPRDMISVGLIPSEYAKIRTYLDSDTGNANVDTAAESFGVYHGVRVYSSTYLPTGVKMLAMVDESVAEPVMTTIYDTARVDLSNAIAFGLFYSYGTQAVTPDLIYKIATE